MKQFCYSMVSISSISSCCFLSCYARKQNFVGNFQVLFASFYWDCGMPKYVSPLSEWDNFFFPKKKVFSCDARLQKNLHAVEPWL